MNELTLEDNGFPFRAQTVRFLQQSYQEAIKNMAKVHGNNYILWGCELVNGNRTAGAIVVNGEVIPFEQSPAADTFKIVETTENATYKSGVVLPAYYSRKAVADSTGTLRFADFPTIAKTRKATDWVDCAPTDEITVIEPIQVRINENGRVQIRGKFTFSNDWSWGRDFDIPAAFCPKYDRVISVRSLVNGTDPHYSQPYFITADGKGQPSSSMENLPYQLNCEYDI